MPRRHSQEWVECEVAKRGSTLVSRYISQGRPLDIRCGMCGEVFQRRLDHLMRTDFCYCMKCLSGFVPSARRYDIERVREIIRGKGAELVSEEYKNSDTPLLIRCSCGEVFSRPYDSIKRSKYLRCRRCTFKVASDLIRLDEDYIAREIERRGCSLVSGYCNAVDKLRIRCRCSRLFERSWNLLYRKETLECPDCYKLKRPRGESHPNFKRTTLEKRKEFGRFNHLSRMLREYVWCFHTVFDGCDSNLEVHHMNARGSFWGERFRVENLVPLPGGYHLGKNSFHTWAIETKKALDGGTYKGHGTKEDLIEYFKIRPEYNGYKLDGEFKDFVLGLDKHFSCELFFGRDGTEDLKFLINRKRELFERGIEFIPLFYRDFVRVRVLGARLFEILGLSRLRRMQGDVRVLNARDLDVVGVGSREAQVFMEENHLQGFVQSSVRYGLVDRCSGELISVMTFGRPRFKRGESGDVYELLRFASKCYVRVRGGASRLFYHFICDYNPDRVITYADLRFSSLDVTKSVYVRMGFKLDHQSSPGYAYVDSWGALKYSRVQFQKHKLRGLYDRGEIKYYNETWSERKVAEENGLIPQYDCGNYVFVWDRS